MKRALLCTFLLLAGCGLDPRSNPAYCESTEDCSAGEECVRFADAEGGLCVSAQRDGGGMDGAMDGGADGGACTPGASCYFGPDGTEDVGTCRAGKITCVGTMAVCREEVTPAASDETCDAVDEDCDGVADEDAPVSSACAIAQPGVCSQGENRCHMGGYSCRPVNEATAERCDTLDNDCDEVVDEDTDVRCYPPEAPRGCTADASGRFTCIGVCAPGRIACAAGVSTCGGAREPAATDGCTAAGTALDDDCDGMIDEDCAEACAGTETRPCYTGSPEAGDRGICELGTQTCSGGVWGACTGAVLPSIETCADPGADNDCNGVDDDIAGLGGACLDEAAMGVCRTGALMCRGGVMSCVTPDPAAMEACDGRDDDCDGAVDEEFDFQTDENHCGMCGRSCGVGRTCCGGECVDTTRSRLHCGDCGNDCSGDEGCCGSACMDLRADPANCGACGNVCAVTQICCDSACVDPRSDAANCGGCGAPCAGGDACCDGTCADPGSTQCTDCTMDCASGETCCAPTCSDTEVDLANCGGCGIACVGEDDLCCDGGCVDTDLDEANCGGCGRTCTGAADTCCDAGCVDTDNDIFHCGACGNECDPGDLCCGGTCVDPTSTDEHCGACGTDCTTVGLGCSNSSCCPAGSTGCGGACVNLATDEEHCGSCGRGCGAGQLCCAGACVNPSQDEQNCGACGTTCSGSTPECCAGGCVNTTNNSSHCGRCGNSCALGCLGTVCLLL